MNIIIVLLILVFIVTIGYEFISLFNLLNGFSKLLKLSYAFGLGVAFVSFQMYVYSRLNMPWTKLSMLMPWIVFILISIIKNRKYLTFTKSKPLKLKKIDVVLIILILFCVFYTAFEALIRPPVTWDSWATWLFQSKIFFIDGKINPKIFLEFGFNYPFAYNLLGTFIYTILGRVDDFAILLTSSAFYVFLALLFFSFLKKRYGLRHALVFTFLFVAMQNLIRHGGRLEAGIADLPVGFFSFSCLTLLLEYINKSRVKILLILSILLGFTAVIKFEGMTLSILIGVIIIYNIFKKKLYNHIPILFFWLLPTVDWQIFRKINGIGLENFISYSFKTSINSTLNAFIGTFKELINIKSWNFLWITFLYSFILIKFNKHKELMIINFVVVSQLVIYILIYIIFSNSYNPESSIERLLIHIAPMAMLGVTMVFSSLGFKDIVNLIRFDNRKIMKFVDNSISWINRN